MYNRKINEEEAKAAEEKKKAADEAHKKYLENLKAQKKAETDALRAVEDLRNQLRADGQEKDIIIAQTASKRVIEDLKERLKTEANLTKKAKAEIAEQIKLQEQLLQQKIADINTKYKEEADKKKADADIKDLDYQIKLNKVISQQRLVGQKLTDEELHRNKIAEIESANLDELDRLKIQKDNKLITEKEYADLVILLNAQKNLAVSTENAAFDESEKEKRKQALYTDYANELDLLYEFSNRALEIKKAQLDEQMNAEIEAAKKTGADTYLIEQKYAKLKRDLDLAALKNKLDGAKQLADALVTIAGENTEVGKAAASAGIAISAIQGGIDAVSQGIKQFGPVAGGIIGGISAAALGVSAAKAISDVWAVSPEGTKTVNISATRDFKSASVYTNLPTLGSFYSGNAQQNETAQVISSNQPDMYVRVTEINDVQNSVKIKENTKI